MLDSKKDSLNLLFYLLRIFHDWTSKIAIVPQVEGKGR
jgi:hypothetical protein